MAGAVANLLDRAPDGVVTDYLHTGWWPTFNLADTFITLGMIILALTVWPMGVTPAKKPQRIPTIPRRTHGS